jgi:protein TonB
MKLLKLLFVFALVSMFAVSCKESKKEEVQDDAVEMTEEGIEADAGDAAAAGSETDENGAAMEKAEPIKTESLGVEEMDVPEGVIAEELADTPVVYPGCTGETADEIRACNMESFVAYVKNAFDKDIAKEANIKSGDYQIKTVVHVNKSGRVFALRVTAPNKALENEMKRVIDKTPQVTPATKGGEPVGISFILPVEFKVEKL